MNRFASALIAAALACGVSVSLVQAQKSSNSSTAVKPTASAEPAEPPSRDQVSDHLVSLKFPGGTVADYTAALKKAAGDVNIIVALDAREVAMPAVELTAASVEAALRVLDGKTFNNGERFVKLIVRDASMGQPGEQTIFNVDAQVGGRSIDSPQTSRVWAIGPILNSGAKANDVLTAVQTALDLLGKQYAPAQLKFHEATGLIIARGSSEQMESIEQVVRQLSGGAEGLQRQLIDCHNQNAALQDRIKQLETAAKH